MDDIKKLQLRALDRIGHFLALLEHSTNEFDIEAQTYTIMHAAESLYKQMHAANSRTGDTPETIIDVTHVRRLEDGSVVSLTEKRPLADMMPTLAAIPKLWAHKHYEDENENEWDVDFVESCDVCKDRMELAVEEHRACAKHPLAYFEEALPFIGKEFTKETAKYPYCEACEAEKRPPQDHGKPEVRS